MEAGISENDIHELDLPRAHGASRTPSPERMRGNEPPLQIKLRHYGISTQAGGNLFLMTQQD
jgi:hypothetical protein